MIGALLLSVVAAPTPVAFLHLVPQPSARSLSTSSLLATTADAIEPITSLEVLPPERVGASRGRLEACPVDRLYTCWVDELRPVSATGPRYLFAIVENDGAEGSAELDVVFLDLEAAVEIRGRRGAGDDAIEAELYDTALRVPPIRVAREAGAIQSALKRLVDDHLAPLLRRNRHWGAPVVGTPIAVIPSPPTTAPSYMASLYGGAAVAVVGIVITVAAIAAADRNLGCIAGPDSPAPNCANSVPVTFSGASGASLGVEPASPIFTPGSFGAALFGGGTAVASGTYFGYQPHEAPVWAWVAGAIGGVVAFSVATLVTSR